MRCGKFRVLVTGGRDYTGTFRRMIVFTALRNLWEQHDRELVVIEGGARGADEHARKWAEAYSERGVEHERYDANWKHGLAAGPIRNSEMLHDGKPDLVLAFPGGRGTRDMVSQARQAGVEIAYGDKVACVA